MIKEKSTSVKNYSLAIFLCLILLIALSANTYSKRFTYGNSLNNISTAKQDVAHISTNISSHKLCSRNGMNVLQLTTQIQIINVGNKTLLPQKDGFRIIVTKIYKDQKAVSEGKPFEELGGIGGIEISDFGEQNPQNKNLIRLTSGESYTTNIKDELLVFDTRNGETYIEPGNYLIEQDMRMWTRSPELGKELKLKWSKDNYFLWLGAITTMPMPILIDKLASTEKCN